MIEIRPKLFLSSLSALPLPRHQSLAVLSLLTPPLSGYPQLEPLPENHLHIPVSDIPSACLLHVLPQCLQFINNQRTQGVLVHCYHGVSRSVAVVVAFLFWTEPQKSLHQHLEELKSIYPTANPSDAFLRQLRAFEASQVHFPMPYSFPPISKAITKFEIDEFAWFLKNLPPYERPEFFLPDPTIERASAKCKRCRKLLLCQRGSIYDNRTFLVLPYERATSSLVTTVGKLRCVCRAKVGRFDWTVDPPRFEVSMSSVDLY